MRFFFNFRNWSVLTNSTGLHSDLLGQKRNVLFSQFCIIGAIAAAIQGFYDLYEGFPYVMLIDMSIAFMLVIGYILNEKRKHRTAKVMVIVMTNLMLFSFAAVIPKDIGIYLLFYPLIMFTFIVLDVRKVKYSYGLVVLTLILFLILILTDFHPFGNINIQPIDPTISYVLNVITSILLLSLGISFLLSINNSSEKILVEKHHHAEGLAIELKEKNKALIKNNEELDRFVYSTSHDLRAPLASVMGLINLAELEKNPESNPEYFEKIKDRIQNLDSFIQDILDYSRNSRVDVVYSDVNIQELVDEVIENNRYLDNASKISFSTSIQIENTLSIDNNRVFRVLNNLVSNAIKYNDLTYSNPSVKVSAEKVNNKLILKVSDTGKGIDESIKSKIFEMFFRGTEMAEGSGLGLYITLEMVNKMNGEISFEDRKGQSVQGTTFTVSIPLSK
ncbi:MAG: HAMP domain-containing sensor histidine kinase [Bacteroidota bacterium]